MSDTCGLSKEGGAKMPEQRFDLDFTPGQMKSVVALGGPPGTPGVPPWPTPAGTHVTVVGLPDLIISEMGQYVGWYWFGLGGNYYVAGADPGSHSFTLPNAEVMPHVELDLWVCSRVPDLSKPGDLEAACDFAMNWPWDVEAYCDPQIDAGSAVEDESSAGYRAETPAGSSCPTDEIGCVPCPLA